MDDEGLRIEVAIEVPSETRYLSLIGRIGEDLAYELDRYSGDMAMLAHQVNLVLTEAAANAMEYGPAGDPSTSVRVCVSLSDDDLCIRVYDQGPGFDLEHLPSPHPERLQERGRGLFIIRSLMDCVTYAKAEGGNVLEMRKRLR
jgi:serine/threonine-protein kinase RsbW